MLTGGIVALGHYQHQRHCLCAPVIALAVFILPTGIKKPSFGVEIARAAADCLLQRQKWSGSTIEVISTIIWDTSLYKPTCIHKTDVFDLGTVLFIRNEWFI